MKEYCYKDIREITELGILFKDGFELLFEECRNGWCVEHNLKTGESQCVAERDSLAKIPYFLSYCDDRIKVLFNKKGIFCRKRNRNDFLNLQVMLNRFGFSTYDLT